MLSRSNDNALGSTHDSQQTGSEEPIVRGRLLDGFLVLAAGGFMLPDEAVRVNLSSLEIVEVSDDLRFFHNLDSLDLSDNFLNYSGVLEHIFVTPRISNLNLSCNQITTLTCNADPVHYPSSFHSLLQLDLSFNELHGDILMSLAPLPKLEKLNLTANCISSRGSCEC
jgi:Leucine-rich repeat (LRR) protein